MWLRTHSQHVPLLSHSMFVHTQVSILIVRFGHSTIMTSGFVSVRIKMFPEEDFERRIDGKTLVNTEIFTIESGKKDGMILGRYFFWWGIMHRNFSSPSPVFLNW